MSNITLNELRNSLRSVLELQGLNQNLINQLLSDDFINGAFELIQNEPENDEFMNFVRNFSEEQNLKSVMDAQNKIAEELGKDGYFSSIFQYVIDAWRDIDFSSSLLLMRTNDDSEDVTPEDIDKGGAILGAVMGMLRVPTPAQTIAKLTITYGKIAVAVHEQDKKFYEIADKYYNDMMDIARGIQSTVTTAESHPSPLVLDLDGDGVETDKENSSIHFDHDNNGFAESSGWVGKDDGLLVRDINGNGQIDNGTELFGDNTVLSNGQKAANGFEALKDLDSNNDGVFNSLDAAWNEVKVWRDANGNGVVDENELLTLEQAGVSGINLDYQNTNTTDGNGNQHNQSGTFIKTDGTTGSIHDVWFDADKVDTVDKIEVDISDEIKALPEIQGFGNVHSLQTAMALDTPGVLKALIEQYAAETDVTVRRGMINNIIFHWTGVQDIDPESRKPSYFYDNPIQDARYLEALERFLGEKYSNKWWFGQEEQNPHEQASKILLQAYDQLSDYVMVKLEEQTHCKGLIEDIKMTWNEETQVWDIDVSQAVATLNSIMEQNFARGINTLYTLESIIQQQDILSEQIVAAFQNSGIDCTTNLQLYLLNFGKFENKISDGSDIIYGNAGNNIINGLSGNDKIYGSAGNDTLIGGEGNDYLVGGEGSDTYFFEGSWGHDSIDNSSADEKGTHPDKILFGDGILPSDVTIQRQGNDLILSLHNGADTIKVYSYFLDAGATTNTVDTIEFADGTTWNYEYVRVAWNSAPVSIGGFTMINGTSKRDIITGTSGDDFISGEDGDDNLSSKSGNDVLYGGAGDDRLNGEAGDDTYIWNWGDGYDTIYDTGNNDTISFGPGITFNDLTFRNIDNGLSIRVKGDPSQGIKILSFMSGLNYKIEKLAFADGSHIPLSEIGLTLYQTDAKETIYGTGFGDIIYANGGDDIVLGGNGNDIIYGGAGNDTLEGRGGNDVLEGGLNNDILRGGEGDDVYVWKLGDGFDTIYDSSGSDRIKFGDGINLTDLQFQKSGSDLKVFVNNDESMGMEIKNHYASTLTYQLEMLEFADGSSINVEDAVAQMTQAMSTFGVDHSATSNIAGTVGENAADMYNLTASDGLYKKAA